MNPKKYKPIDCDFYDLFEIHAMQGTWLHISYLNQDVQNSKITRIKTLKTENKSEYAVMFNDEELRLDEVLELRTISKYESILGHLLDILDYNLWANERIIKVLEMDALSLNIKTTFSHIINAHDIWNKRMMQKSNAFSVWQEHSPQTWEALCKKTFFDTVAVLNSTSVDQIVSYQNSSGDRHQSSVAEIINHSINHSTYHRGQIITFLQVLGLKTVPTDYIIFSRKNL